MHGPVNVLARGRDLLTAADGAATVVATAGLDLQVDFSDGVITTLRADPPVPELQALVGTTTFRRFRAALEQAVAGRPEHERTVQWQLLDDLPMTTLLSGRVLRAAGIGIPRRDPNGPLPVDICAGWVADGTLVSGFTEFGPPLRPGPPAVAVAPDDDLLGWHEHEALPPHSTRRRRRLDVWVDGGVGLAECFFRDSHVDASGFETVVHEYTVGATVDLETLRIVECDAVPGALPYPECPGAAASAEHMASRAVDGLRRSVLVDFVGPSTCTHLNDAFRSLEDVGALLRVLG
jgi:hypothetical protein